MLAFNAHSSRLRPGCGAWIGLLLMVVLAWTGLASGEPKPAPGPSTNIDWKLEREFWSFRAPVSPATPAVKNQRWPRQSLDFFILARLEQARLGPALAADPRTLIRRVTLDLTGLPPTPTEVDAFLKDTQPGAYERLVDRLLASPRFGERMASLWLPLARYAEDQAHQVGTDTKFFYPHAYKYRDWVIGAFNRDLPYDQFIKLQLAADKLCEKPGTPASKASAATPVADLLSPDFSASETPTADLAALGFLGLGPKYYNRNRLDVMADEWEDRVDTVTRSMLGLTVACSRCHDHKFEPVSTEDYYALAGVFASTRMVNKVPGGVTPKEDNSETPPKEKLNAAVLHMVEEGTPTNLNVFIRGNVDRKGPVAERHFLRVLCAGEPTPFQDGSGRRELAEAIASRGNPLTARVLVNRIWGQFFGQPLVATPSNLGHSGSRPTHPELLDDLAVRFMDQGWSVKTLVREILLSSTYRQSCEKAGPPTSSIAPARASHLAPAEAGDDLDPSNELLSHMNRRRLTIEQWRDQVLFVSGTLDYSSGESLELDDVKNRRRTVHARVSRLKLNDLLMQFDYPDANVHAEKRSTTTTAIQKLFLLNSPFMLGQAEALSARLTAAAGESNRSRVTHAYQLLFSRDPGKSELDAAVKFLSKPDAGGRTRWQQYAQVLLASNELLYVD